MEAPPLSRPRAMSLPRYSHTGPKAFRMGYLPRDWRRDERLGNLRRHPGRPHPSYSLAMTAVAAGRASRTAFAVPRHSANAMKLSSSWERYFTFLVCFTQSCRRSAQPSAQIRPWLSSCERGKDGVSADVQQSTIFTSGVLLFSEMSTEYN